MENSKRILVFNCGSSSLKYRIYRMPGEEPLVEGEAERVGIKTDRSAIIHHASRGVHQTIEVDLPTHAIAFNKVMELIQKDESVGFDCFAHRYVHPGNQFNRTTLVTAGTFAKLKKTLSLAPIHNPVSYELVELCQQYYPRIPQYLVFDTSFHASIPDDLATYAIPKNLADRYGIRKIGFHGISHQFVAAEACAFLGLDPSTTRIISCHLGTGGSSVCAISEGHSINSSMGFTPLEGLIMNTRSGDLDVGLLLYLMHSNRLNTDDIEKTLNKKSGVLGLYQSSSDLRDLIKRMGDDPEAKRAFNMYCRRVKKYIGFYGLLLKKPDIVIFTDTLGVVEAPIRREAIRGLEYLGIRMDQRKNEQYSEGIGIISTADSEATVMVVPNNEELMIAREACRVA